MTKEIILGADSGINIGNIQAFTHAARLHIVVKRQKVRVTITVERAVELSPSLRRLIFSCSDFDSFSAQFGESTDTYVKLAFPHEDGEEIRTYTVVELDQDARELAIDFVIHGDQGIAGPWARDAQTGQSIDLMGPGGAYRPDHEADHHLFVGDESAIPAIAASLRVLSPEDKATAFIEVDDADHEIDLPTAAQLDLHWLHRAPAAAGTTALLFDAVQAWPWPDGRVQAFVHGESALLKTVRPFLLDGKVERRDISVSAYWRRGVDEGGFRDWKASQTDAVMRPGDSAANN